MKQHKHLDMLTASAVANRLNISVKTLNNWYKWQNDDSILKPKYFPRLPDYIQDYENSARYWSKDCIKEFEDFQEWMPRGRSGIMGDVSCKYYRKMKKEHCCE